MSRALPMGRFLLLYCLSLFFLGNGALLLLLFFRGVLLSKVNSFDTSSFFWPFNFRIKNFLEPKIHFKKNPIFSKCFYYYSFVFFLIGDPAIPLSPLFDVKASTLLRSEGTIIEASTAANMAQPSTFVTEENAFKWVKNDKRRMLHVVYRVGDLDKTIKFYTECLGMKLLRKRDIPEERYSNAFLGYGPEDSHFTVELTYNYGVDKYDIGTGFGHFGIAVEDVAKTVDLVKAKGGKVTRDPGPVKGGNTVIAFVKDPDGYTFELLERGPTPEPLCQVMLRVGDLDRAINFYKKAYGMELLRKRDNPEYKYTIAMMGYGPEDKNAVVELTYNYGVKEYDKGNGYAQIAIGTNDVYKTAEAIQLCGGKIILEPGPLPGINTKITACLDPDGWKSVFVDNVDFLKELE